jgi:hypothetical protein
MNDHDYRYEELKQREYDRNRQLVRAIIARHHGDTHADAYTEYIMKYVDLTGMSFKTIATLADDLFVCDSCGEVEDKQYQTELDDICETCAGNF